MSVNLFETRELTQQVNQLYPIGNFLTNTFFKNVKNPESEHIDVTIKKGKRRLAPFVSPKVGGKVVTSLGKTVATYKPAYIKDKRIFDVDTALSAQNVFYADKLSPQQRLATRITEDLADQVDMIARRVEHMAAQALTTGTVSIVGDGIDEVVDFGMDSDHLVTLTGTALWSNSASDPRANLKTWRTLMQKDSGISPNIMIGDITAIDAYVNHPKVKDTLDSRRIDMGMINPTILPGGVTYYGFDRELGLDIYSYVEWYFDEETGEDVSLMPAGKIILGSDKAQTVLAHGMIKDLKALYATKYFTKSWEEEDPSVRYLLTQSAPLTIPTQIDAFMCNKVV